jgi:Tfp pilus assembly protein PilW
MKHQKTITLVELMISLVLFIILAGSFLWIFTTGLKLWHFGKNRAGIRQGGTLAIDRMVRELSQASSFTIVQSNQVKFDADLDNDGSDETVTFVVEGGDLIETIDGTAAVLAANVDTLIFSYRDLNDDVMSFPVIGGDYDNVRVVTVSLVLDEEDETITLSSSAYTRNQGL